MGWSPLDRNRPKARLYIGDEPFDAVSECFAEVCRLYERDWKRRPKLAELLGTVEAVLETQLQDHTSDGDTNELVSITAKTRKRPKRQKYATGDILMARAANGEAVYARIFDDDVMIGPMVGVYDSLGMSRRDLRSIIVCPLAVKICPIHREILQNREWTVIGNRKTTAKEKKLPRGPLEIAGTNLQLEAANYFYGFCKKPFYGVDEWLAQPKKKLRTKR